MCLVVAAHTRSAEFVLECVHERWPYEEYQRERGAMQHLYAVCHASGLWFSVPESMVPSVR
jgi:hypothetical protein